MNVKFYNVIYPGKGYRLVNIGEALCAGDEVSLLAGLQRDVTNREWKKVGVVLVGQTINKPGERDEAIPLPYGYYRRKIAN